MIPTTVELVIPCQGLNDDVHAYHMRVTVHALGDPNDPQPMVFAFYGPEYNDRGKIVDHWLDAMASQDPDKKIPRCRLVLLHPMFPHCANWYQALPDAMHDDVLPLLCDMFVTIGKKVMVGGSIGALDALSCAFRYPEEFGGLFLQSTSFFNHITRDAQGMDPEILAFVAEVLASEPTDHKLVIGLTCGAEGNLPNNWLLHNLLEWLGHEVFIKELTTTHDFESWGEALPDYLTYLLRLCWTESAQTVQS